MDVPGVATGGILANLSAGKCREEEAKEKNRSSIAKTPLSRIHLERD